MAALTKALRARLDLLPPAEREAVMRARRSGYVASLDAAGNIVLTPRKSRARKKKRTVYADPYSPHY